MSGMATAGSSTRPGLPTLGNGAPNTIRCRRLWNPACGCLASISRHALGAAHFALQWQPVDRMVGGEHGRAVGMDPECVLRRTAR